MYMTAVLMSVGSRVIKSRVIYRSWLLVHHHIVGGATNAAAWVGLDEAFGEPSMEAILSCGVPRMPNTIWDTTYKLNKGGSCSYWELYTKDLNRDKESMSTEVLIPHKDPLCLIEGPSMFIISSHT